jgi:surfactin synthase thioesterase subunit
MNPNWCTTPVCDVPVDNPVRKSCVRHQSLLFPGLDAEVDRLRPAAVTFAGMSMGGSVAKLSALYVAKRHGHKLDRKVRGGGVTGGCFGW